MKKSLSLIVAAAMTLTSASAVFADNAPTLSPQEKFDALKAAQIVSGYPDGSAGLEKEMTRAEFAKVLTLVAGLTPDATAATYSDVPAAHWAAGYIGAATKAGLLNGLGGGKFGPSGKVTIEQIAKVADLFAKVAIDENATVAGAVSAWAKAYVAAAIKAGFVEESSNYKANAVREQLINVAYTLYGATQVAVKSAVVVDSKNIEVTFTDGGVVKKALDTALVAGTPTKVSVDYNGKSYEVEVTLAAIKLDSVTAATSKTLKVAFNQAVDTAKATFEVKKDGVKINTSAITFNEAKTEATVELTSKISKGEYAVNVSGLVEGTVLSGTVTTADEKVAKIEVLTAEAPILADNSVDVAYKVTNQYGEDITKVTSVITSSGTADPSKGKVHFDGPYDIVTNKTIAFTIINVDSNVTTTAVVTVVAEATESQVAIVGVYNKDNKTLAETTDLSKDKFFLEIEVKDQYGNVISSPEEANLIVSETNSTIVNLDDNNQVPVLDTTTVDGKVLIALEAPVAGLKAGSSTITLISKKTGKSTAKDVVVAEGARANSVTIGQPALVAAGEDALLPLTVLDKSGNAITDLDVLNSATRGISVATGNTLVKDAGVVYVKVPTPAEGPNVALVTIKPTQQIVTVNYTVRAAAKPAVITGLDKEIQKSISVGLTQDIKAQDLIVEDQYGRVMTDAKVNEWIEADDNALVVTSTYDAATDKSPFEVNATGAADSDAAKQVITEDDDVITLTAKGDAGLNSTEKVTFALSSDEGDHVIAATSKDVTFSKVGVADFASFEIAAPAVVYNDTTKYDFKVYGVKADGSKTLLKADQYNLVKPTEFTVDGTNNNKVSLAAALADTVIDTDSVTTQGVTKDFTFKAVIKDDAASTVTQKVTVSAEARKAVKFALASDGTSGGDALTALEYTTATLNLATIEANLYYVDQYGLETETDNLDAGTILTFSNLTSVAGAIDANGTAGAAVTGLATGDTVKVKIETAGLAAQTFTVTIK
ncbi:S-layer homology domain-containing protein [Paenibacillus sp. OV219]|nr:S-layer homology domain-containing protein [Paenibacillus sp. OV219]